MVKDKRKTIFIACLQTVAHRMVGIGRISSGAEKKKKNLGSDNYGVIP